MKTTTAQLTARIDDGPEVPAVLTIETEQIDVTTRTKPDPEWEYVDPSGHYHAWTKDRKLPTLRAKDEHRECNGCGDDYCEGYYVTVYECEICGAPVEPQTTTSAYAEREFMDGPTTWRVEVQQNLDVGQRVTVRLLAPGRTYFGVGVVDNWEVEHGPSGTQWISHIHGAGPLGERGAPIRRR